MTQLRRRRRGSALLLVIGVLVLLSVVGTTFVAMMRIERQAARNYETDAALSQLAKQALAFCLQHPNWNPPTGTDINNDNMAGEDSAFFTEPLAGFTTDVNVRWAILKKRFDGRVNVNWNSHYVGPNNENHILNEGVTPAEISLVDPIAAYLDHLGSGGFPVGTSDENLLVAHEIARRICNLRYGQPAKPIGAPPYPVGTNAAYKAYPGGDGVDDDDWLHDTATLLVEPPAPPLGLDQDDEDRWLAPNWRPNPGSALDADGDSIGDQSDRVDNDGDGLFDEIDVILGVDVGEGRDDPAEFTEYPRPFPPGLWPANDDQPFGLAALLSIIEPTTYDSDLESEVNDVCNNWAITQGYAFNAGINYFEYLSILFTTRSFDFVGTMTPLNHLNIIGPRDDARVRNDRARFIAALTGAFEEDGMSLEAAELTAWQVMANLVDFLDEDPDLVGPLGDLGLLTALAKPEGWDPANDDTNNNDVADPGEPNTRLIFGTERQPYINEVWIYNRGDDRFDNDGDGVTDNDPTKLPVPDPLPQEIDRDGYFIELFNHYNSEIVLFNDPAGVGDPKVDWYIRIKDDSDNIVLPVYPMSNIKIWQAGAWTVADGNSTITIPAGEYLIIEGRDYAPADNAKLNADGHKKLPDPTDAATIPAGATLLNLDLADDVKLFEPDFTIELVYSYDPDGTGPIVAFEAVVDRQKIPTNAMSIETSTSTGARDFAPSWERHDPRLARVVRTPKAPAGASLVGDLLLPTWSYRDAENTTPNSGGDEIYHTLGAVNDADDGDADVFDGNYDLGNDTAVRYDDLVDVVNTPSWKFANVGALGKLLCVGPLPADPTSEGWNDPETVAVGDVDYWLITSSPYTAVPAQTGFPTRFQTLPLDAKKIDFLTESVRSFSNGGWYTPDPDGAPENYPTGRATAVFDKFTTIYPQADGKDNDGDWNGATDETDVTDTDGNLTDDPGPTPGDRHVDENDEIYVPGRIDLNNSSQYVLSALPFVKFGDQLTDRMFVRSGLSDVDEVFLHTWDIYGERTFESRRDFYRRVVQPAIDIGNLDYDPAVPVGAFGRDTEDNHVIEDGANVLRRTAWPYEWQTIQRPPRTIHNQGLTPHYDFMLPGADAFSDGRDGLVDDKSEIDYTVGALMNMVGLDMELPAGFASPDAALGIYTYYITVQITDGHDVDGIQNNGPKLASNGDHPNDANEPDWAEGTVLSEKRIIALVNTSLPLSDPRRITVFNWAVAGRAPEK